MLPIVVTHLRPHPARTWSCVAPQVCDGPQGPLGGAGRPCGPRARPSRRPSVLATLGRPSDAWTPATVDVTPRAAGTGFARDQRALACLRRPRPDRWLRWLRYGSLESVRLAERQGRWRPPYRRSTRRRKVPSCGRGARWGARGGPAGARGGGETLWDGPIKRRPPGDALEGRERSCRA